MTLLCAWLALQSAHVTQRETMIRTLQVRGVVAIRKDPCQPAPTISIIRRLMGDKPVAIFDLQNAGIDEDEAQQIANIFPEAHVYLNREQPILPNTSNWLYF